MSFFTGKEIETLTGLELEVYNYIIENSNKIPYMTIRELAEEAHVSTTTIVNFCKKLNCDGFSEFKVKYKMAQKEKPTAVLNEINPSLESFMERFNTAEFNRSLDIVSEVLAKGTNLIFVGFGSSGIMAKYAANYFSAMGRISLHLENPMFELSSLPSQGNVVIIFSVSGDINHEIHSVADIPSLKANNTTIVSVTNSKSSHLAKISDYNISYYIQTETLGNGPVRQNITTQIPVMYIIETLAKKTYNLNAKNTL